MMNAIATDLGLETRDILENPKKLRKFDLKSVTQTTLCQPPFLSTWSCRTGRCTSFALNVAHCLEMKYPTVFNFDYYDVRKHRVARCKNTGVLIDSSLASGAVYLKETKEWTTISGLKGRWTYSNNILTYERKPETGTKAASPITAETAIGTCLQEVAKDATLLCLFRHFTTGESQSVSFGGMIKRIIPNKCIKLIPDLATDSGIITITFSPNGTRETLQQCIYNLEMFIEEFGDIEKWEADGNRKIHEALWESALNLWGPLIWVKTSPISRLLEPESFPDLIDLEELEGR
ncbi:hypothetical protein GGR54DRAFT_326949 [Hypoxylon sp. NC1633]|nr:hypothetical protein GGR54DRAFT_326949 [Hypoxylon sp. NC1633]